MKLLVAYSTSEGQTRKIARFVADRLHGAGHTVELYPLSEGPEIDLSRFDRAVLAASIHGGKYQRALTEMLNEQSDALNALPTLFLSVSLAAAGHDAEDWRALDHILGDLSEATGWRPDRVAQVAGAYMPSEYDLFTRFIMRRIVGAKDPDADLQADKDYTDWDSLGQVVDDWMMAGD